MTDKYKIKINKIYIYKNLTEILTIKKINLNK